MALKIKHKTLQAIFLQICKGRGDAIVYHTGFRRLTYSYAQFEDLCYRMITLLRKQGIKKGDRVMIWGFNGPEWLVAFWGCVLGGVIVVPHDFRADEALGKKFIKRAGVRLSIQSKLRPRLHKHCLYLEDLFYSLEGLARGRIVKVGGSAVVEIVYTSGTTGEPKGVVLTHHNIAVNLAQLHQMYSDGKVVFLSLLPLSHMFEQAIGMLFPLFHHGTIVYVKQVSKPVLREVLSREPIEVIVLVPRLLELLLFGRKIPFVDWALIHQVPLWVRRLLFAPVHRRIGKQFKFFVIGGAPLSHESELRVDALGLELLQGYGLTETGPVLSCNFPGNKKLGTVGQIVPGVLVKFLDDEILVTGPNIFKGYYQDKKRTKETFWKGWFRTGDLGKLEDGFLKLLGRKKDMIVLSSGLNVYPQDIEGVVKLVPGVKDCVVLGMPSKKGEIPVGVVLLKKRRDMSEILEQANARLKGVTLEDIIVWPFPDFPRTSTLKPKRFEMLDYLLKHKKPVSLQTPKGSVEQILSGLTHKHIAATSQLEKDLGLSSLDRMELVGRVQESLGVELPEDKISGDLTVRALISLVEQHKGIKKPGLQRWSQSSLSRGIRFLGLQLFIFPIVRYFCNVTVTGKGNLKGLQEPVIFVCNHQSHFDLPVLYSVLEQRGRIAAAAWAEYFQRKGFYGRFAYYFTCLIFNTYMFPQTTGFRQAMKHTGLLIDDNWNIFLFPEGSRSFTEKLLPFQKGIGFLAKEMRVQIVPIHIRGLVGVLPKTNHWPKKGDVSVHIGKPIAFADESIVALTKKVEKAIKEL